MGFISGENIIDHVVSVLISADYYTFVLGIETIGKSRTGMFNICRSQYAHNKVIHFKCVCIAILNGSIVHV